MIERQRAFFLRRTDGPLPFDLPVRFRFGGVSDAERQKHKQPALIDENTRSSQAPNSCPVSQRCFSCHSEVLRHLRINSAEESRLRKCPPIRYSASGRDESPPRSPIFCVLCGHFRFRFFVVDDLNGLNDWSDWNIPTLSAARDKSRNPPYPLPGNDPFWCR